MTTSVSAPDSARGELDVQPTPLRAGKLPVGNGPVVWIGIVLAVTVTALGVLGIVEALIGAGTIGGQSWIAEVATRGEGLRPARWLVPVGAATILLGLLLVIAALRRRPRRAVALTSATGVFLRPADLARLSEASARRIDSVIDAHATATRRTVSVNVTTTTTQTAELEARVGQAVPQRLRYVAKPPRVRTRVGPERMPR